MSRQDLLLEIERWSTVYQFSFQFWGPGNNNVYIHKADIELASFGDEDDIEAILTKTLEWVNKQNPGGYKKKIKQRRCGVCGTPIIGDRDFCEGCISNVQDDI